MRPGDKNNNIQKGCGMNADTIFFWNRIIVIAGALFFLYGCGHVFYPACRHKAMYAAIVAAENGHHVRIASGVTSDGHHAQAEALIDDRWQWLCVGRMWDVYTCEQDNFTPLERWAVNDYYVSRFWHLMERMK